jgi:methylmalonyl-CoA/ethylmalonyl-CoA epimerase
MKIDHICYAVRDIRDGIAYWENIFGYKQITEIVTNKEHEVNVVFMGHDDSIMVKLIEPLPENESLKNFVKREGGFHHLCFRCSDLDETIAKLRDKGLRVLFDPAPGEAFENHNIAFLLARFGMNIELIDTDKKTAIIEV